MALGGTTNGLQLGELIILFLGALFVVFLLSLISLFYGVIGLFRKNERTGWAIFSLILALLNLGGAVAFVISLFLEFRGGFLSGLH
jgi:hypothetical protein